MDGVVAGVRTSDGKLLRKDFFSSEIFRPSSLGANGSDQPAVETRHDCGKGGKRPALPVSAEMRASETPSSDSAAERDVMKPELRVQGMPNM